VVMPLGFTGTVASRTYFGPKNYSLSDTSIKVVTSHSARPSLGAALLIGP
jgi:hypothetical protein